MPVTPELAVPLPEVPDTPPNQAELARRGRRVTIAADSNDDGGDVVPNLTILRRYQEGVARRRASSQTSPSPPMRRNRMVSESATAPIPLHLTPSRRRQFSPRSEAAASPTTPRPNPAGYGHIRVPRTDPATGKTEYITLPRHMPRRLMPNMSVTSPTSPSLHFSDGATTSPSPTPRQPTDETTPASPSSAPRWSPDRTTTSRSPSPTPSQPPTETTATSAPVPAAYPEFPRGYITMPSGEQVRWITEQRLADLKECDRMMRAHRERNQRGEGGDREE